MQSSANLKVRTHHQQSEWELSSSLWKSPSSPPYTQAQSSTPFSSSDQKTGDSHASSPSTPSEFEFDSICSLKVRDDPPASPKLISSSTSEYWSTTYSFGARRTTGRAEDVASLGIACTTSGAEVSLIGIGGTTPATIINHKVALLSHPITSTKQSSTPPASPSVRQLMAEEMLGDHEDDDGLALDFYSAPQTPTPPRKSSKQRALSQDHEPTFSIGGHGGQRKSKSVVLERRAPFELAPLATQSKNQLLQSSKSESHEYFFSSSSPCGWEKNEEDKGGVLKKQGSSSKSFKKWAFKDILRRTVPSSKAEAHYRTRVLGATSSKTHLSSRESTPIMSPTASPSRSHMHQHINSTLMSTLEAGRPPSTPPTQSPHRRTSMPTSSPGRTPSPSPPRSPMSPHAAHYQRQKAQSQDLSRKTFLPYRQSLLGCLGGPSAFPLEQHVW